MSGKVAGKVHHQRECAWCHGGIASDRPVFLVAEKSGGIVGPFHAGCAARLAMEAKKHPDHNWVEGAASFGKVLPAREETLPW